MELKSDKPTNQTSSSATANQHKTYSARELGEMMNTHPAKLMSIDIGLCTDWYTNDDYMEEMLSYVVDEKRMYGLIDIILIKQEYQTCSEHHPRVCYRVKDNRKYAPFVEDLKEKLDAMCIRVLHSREIEAKMAEMEKKWTQVSMSAEDVSTIMPSNVDSTANPNYSSSNSDNDLIEYKMDDLPKVIQDQILIPNDQLYSAFVKTLKGPIKEWIGNHHLQDWNVVRFICRLRGIIARKCSMKIFGSFLECIGLGNQENNMKQRKEANNDSFLIDFDDPKKKKNFWKLKNDGDAVEKILAPIIEKMNETE